MVADTIHCINHLLNLIYRYFAICHPVLFQITRAGTSPYFEIGIAFACGTIIQIPHSFATQVTDPSCLTNNINGADKINLTVLCPCQGDENDLLPSCTARHDCPVWVDGLYKTVMLL